MKSFIEGLKYGATALFFAILAVIVGIYSSQFIGLYAYLTAWIVYVVPMLPITIIAWWKNNLGEVIAVGWIILMIISIILSIIVTTKLVAFFGISSGLAFLFGFIFVCLISGAGLYAIVFIDEFMYERYKRKLFED